MSLSTKKLLLDYFTVEDLKDALSDINEKVSGTKEELIKRLTRTWKEHNRDNYELLEFLDDTSLQMICYYYNLDATPASINTYIRRIKNSDLLNQNSRKLKNQNNRIKSQKDIKPFNDVNINIENIHLSKNSKIGIAIGITGVLITAIGVIISSRF